MSSTMPPGSSALLRHRSFLLFLLSRSFSRFSSQIAAVAIGWQVYDLTGSAFDLGMVGLVQFLPTLLLVFVAGHAADRYERKRVVQVCQLAEALTAVFLAWGAYAGSLTVAQIFIATAVLGTAGAFESPTIAALLPLIVPEGTLQRATALSSGAAQLATIIGPALDGLAYAIAPGVPYGVMALFWLLGTLLTGAIRLTKSAAVRDAATPADLFAGVRFVRIGQSELQRAFLDDVAAISGVAGRKQHLAAFQVLRLRADGNDLDHRLGGLKVSQIAQLGEDPHSTLKLCRSRRPTWGL